MLMRASYIACSRDHSHYMVVYLYHHITWCLSVLTELSLVPCSPAGGSVLSGVPQWVGVVVWSGVGEESAAGATHCGFPWGQCV